MVEKIQFKTIFLIFVILSAVLIGLVALIPNNDTVDFAEAAPQPFNENWYYENEDRIISLPDYVDVAPGEEVILKKQIPEQWAQNSSNSLSVRTSLQSLQVAVGGEVVHQYAHHPDRYFDTQIPPAWHIIRLGGDDYGKEITLTFASISPGYGGVLNPIEVGTKYAHVDAALQQNIISLVLCLFIFTFGIFALLVYGFSRGKIPEMKNLFYIGCFAILISIWSACETKSLQLLTGNVQLIMFATFLCIMLAPIPLLLFFRERFTGKMRKAYNVFILFFMGCFLVVVVLQMCSVLDFNALFLAFICALAVMLVFLLFSLIWQYCRQRTRQNKLLLVAMSVLILLAMVDIFRYVFAELFLTSVADTAVFLRLGLLVFIVFLVFSTLDQVFGFYKEGNKAEKYRNQAYTDALTGLNNRVYLADIYRKVFENCVRNKICFTVILLDIDFFKSYNDHYGHLQGDEVIQRVGTVIKENAARSLDAAIRYGGEEFLILLPDVPLEGAFYVCDKIAAALREKPTLHEYSGVANSITVTQGIYSGIPVRADQMDEFIGFADRAMYEAKRNGRNRILAIDDAGSILHDES